MLVAVVAPHEDNTKRWAKVNGHVGSFAELCLLNELKAYILSELKQIAQKNEVTNSLIFQNYFCNQTVLVSAKQITALSQSLFRF